MIGAIIGLSANGSWALTQGQKSAEASGAGITWFELEPGYTDCYIHDLGLGLYELQMSNTDFSKNKRGYVNARGEFVLKPGAYETFNSYSSLDEQTILIKESSDFKLISSEGITSIDATEFSDISYFRNGYATVTLKSNSNKGVIDKNGKLIFEDKERRYQGFEFLGSGVFAAKINDSSYQFLDYTGIPLTESTYTTDWSFQISEERILAMKDRKYGYLDLSGSEIIPFIYDEARSFYEGLAAVCKDGKWGFIDPNGAEVLPFEFDSVYSFEDGLAPVSKEEKWGMVDKTGKIVIPLEHERLFPDGNGFFQAAKNGSTILIDIEGNPAIPGDYSYIYLDESGRFSVAEQLNGGTAYAYLDKDANFLTGWKEFHLYPSGDQLFIGKKSGEYPPGVVPPHDYGQKFALLDSAGNRLTSFKYQNTGDVFNNYQVFTKYYYDSAGLLNQHGAEVLPTIFDQIYLTDEGYAFVQIHDYDTGTNYRAGYFKIPDSFADKANKPPVTVYLNGVELYFDSDPTIKNQKTMVPLRKIFEALGAGVEWDGSTKTVTASSGGKSLSLTIGSDTAYVNGSEIQLDAAPFIQDELTFVPLRFVSESLDADVQWDDALRRVIITQR